MEKQKLILVSLFSGCGGLDLGFEKAGFKIIREEGSHLMLVKNRILRPVVIPKYSSVPVFIIKNNLRVAGMSREDYFRLL